MPLDFTEEAVQLLAAGSQLDGPQADGAAARAASDSAQRAGEVDGEGRRVQPSAGSAAERGGEGEAGTTAAEHKEQGEEEEEEPVFPGPGFALMPPTPALLLRRVRLSSVPSVAGIRAFGACSSDGALCASLTVSPLPTRQCPSSRRSPAALSTRARCVRVCCFGEDSRALSPVTHSHCPLFIPWLCSGSILRNSSPARASRWTSPAPGCRWRARSS